MKNIFIASLLITAFFCSCKTEQRARKGAKKFYTEHPAELAAQYLEKFPAKIEYREGKTVFIAGDTVVIPGKSIMFPRWLNTKAATPETEIIRDTIKIVDTFRVENVARIVSLRYRIDTAKAAADILRADLTKVMDRRDYWKAAARSRLWIVVFLALLIAISIYLNIRKVI